MYMMELEGYKFQSAISKHKFLKCRLFMTLTHVVSFGLELRRANPSNEDAFRMLNSKSHKANWTRISSKHHMFTDNMCCFFPCICAQNICEASKSKRSVFERSFRMESNKILHHNFRHPDVWTRHSCGEK